MLPAEWTSADSADDGVEDGTFQAGARFIEWTGPELWGFGHAARKEVWPSSEIWRIG
ncbi:MAG: hypothetical protein RJA19_165 [Bacteroidota bacterium]